MNTLSQRLKFAKQELTNLKTAHGRGIGNLKVYSVPVKLNYTGTSEILNLVVNFVGSGVSYPFTQVFASMNSSTYEYNLSIWGAGYTNGGRTYKMMGDYHSWVGMNTIYVESTLPISSVTYTWGRQT
jgi:hypothetical protein